MTNTLHQWLFGNKKNYWHRETTLGFAAPPPFHPCVLERGCRKHNTNGSGITLNIQMGKLIVYAWIHRCDYLAPLASLLRSLKATPSAFCFHLPPLKKKKKKSFDHTTRLRRRSSTPWIYIDKRVFAFLFFFVVCCGTNLWSLCRVQSSFCDKHPQRGASLKWQKRRTVLPPNSCCGWAKISVTFTPALSLCACYYVRVASWFHTWKHKNIWDKKNLSPAPSDLL